MEKQLSETAVFVRQVILSAWRRGEISDADLDWADDRRSSGMAATEILEELLDRAIQQRKQEASSLETA